MTVGWYVHHHGRGHLTRLSAIAPHVGRSIRVFSSLEEPSALPENCTWTLLPRDDDAGVRAPQDADPTAGGMLHWAPLAHPGHRTRLAAIAASIARDPVDAFVVDVSAEVTLFVRLLGVPPVLITQPGRREDSAHRLAFAAAAAIVAPWPRALLEPEHLRAYADKTVYTGGISRFAHRSTGDAQRQGVVLLGGAGGTQVTDASIAAAAAASGAPWRILGGGSWSDDPWAALREAGVVVSWAGQNAIADIAAAGAPAVIVPQDRPFDEQRETGRALERAGLAVVAQEWPAASAWPDVLARAAAMTPEWSRWQVAGAAERAAATITATAEAWA